MDSNTTRTIKSPEGSKVSICPERGGIITSLKLDGKEILYLDEASLKSTDGHVRGGIPILFPNAGPIESGEFPNLKQHGFARDSSGWTVEKSANGFTETLESDPGAIAVYPYKFRLSIEGKFEDDGSFTLHQQVKNLEQEKDLPVSMGLHPYFIVPHAEKHNIKFNFDGGKLIEQKIEQWANGEMVSVDNPGILDVVIPGMGTLRMNVSPEYRKIWIWSQPEKDFVCIEPVMRDLGGLIKNPEIVKPGEIFTTSVSFSVVS